MHGFSVNIVSKKGFTMHFTLVCENDFSYMNAFIDELASISISKYKNVFEWYLMAPQKNAFIQNLMYIMTSCDCTPAVCAGINQSHAVVLFFSSCC